MVVSLVLLFYCVILNTQNRIWSALKNQEIEKDPESDEEPFDVYMSRCTLNPYRL